MADWDAIELNPDLGKILDSLAGRLSGETLLKSALAEGEFLRTEIVLSLRDLAESGTGNLRDSYAVELVDQSRHEVSVGVFSDTIYAKTQDEGDTITPKTVKWLAIPHRYAKNYVRTRWPRDFPKDHFVFRQSKNAPNKKAYLFEEGRLKPVFILVRKVTIPGLRYLDHAMDKFGKDVEKPLNEWVGLAFEKAGFK